MKIAIYGAGAIGGYLGAHLALAGEDRIVYDADPSAIGDEPRHLQRKASLAEPG